MQKDNMKLFVEGVANHFTLGDPGDIDVSSMKGSANRLWKFSIYHSNFVVKELSHDPPEYLERRREAAAFEQRIFDDGPILMPELISAITGEFICLLTGSRGQPVSIRVHHWMDNNVNATPDRDYFQEAGGSLHAIQVTGQNWSSTPQGSLSQAEQEPHVVLDRLRAVPELSSMWDTAHSMHSKSFVTEKK